MSKIKIAFFYLAYPFTIANYFRRALERRLDVELFVGGPFWGQDIPWAGGMKIPNKYMNSIDLPLPRESMYPSWESIEPMLPWKPDLTLVVDAGWNFSTKPRGLSATIGTDPHVLDYRRSRQMTNYFFNMQSFYASPEDKILPYAFDPTCHYVEHNDNYAYNASLIGLHYQHRDQWVNRLKALGYSVNYRLGDIYDEYRQETMKARIGLNWSSLKDTNARAFELLAMKRVTVMNRLPGLDELGLREGQHYLGFSDLDEAAEKVVWAEENKEFSDQIALNGYQYVNSKGMTYDTRCQEVLKTVGLVV